MRPPAQAPPQKGFCPGGRALWLGENAEFKTFEKKDSLGENFRVLK